MVPREKTVRKARAKVLRLLLASLVVCLIVGTAAAGCGSSSIVGVYRCYQAPWGSPTGHEYELVPHWRLELKSNGTYTQTTNDPDTVFSVGTSLDANPPKKKAVYKTYHGTYAVRNNPKGWPYAKKVVLNGEPESINTYQVIEQIRVPGKKNPVRITGLSNWGLWFETPPPGAK